MAVYGGMPWRSATCASSGCVIASCSPHHLKRAGYRANHVDIVIIASITGGGKDNLQDAACACPTRPSISSPRAPGRNSFAALGNRLAQRHLLLTPARFFSRCSKVPLTVILRDICQHQMPHRSGLSGRKGGDQRPANGRPERFSAPRAVKTSPPVGVSVIIPPSPFYGQHRAFRHNRAYPGPARNPDSAICLCQEAAPGLMPMQQRRRHALPLFTKTRHAP